MHRLGVLFDLDGTLLDSVADIGNSMNAVLVEHGMPAHSLESYRDLVGEGAWQLARDALPLEASQDLHRSVYESYRERYRKNLLVASAPYPGIPELLDALSSRGVPLAIVTNKPHDATLEIASALFSRWTFDSIFGQREGIPHKPDATMALDAASRMRCAPADCLFVGDTRIDMLTARAARMRAIGVLWGFRDRAELEAHGADTIISRPLELLSLVEGELGST